MDFDEVTVKAKAARNYKVPVTLFLDGDLAARHQRLEQQLQQVARSDLSSGEDIGTEPPSVRLARQIRELEAEAEDAGARVTFTFANVGAHLWDEILADHPPDESDVQRGRDYAATFLPAAMAESCVDPEGATPEGFRALHEQVSSGQWEQLRVGLFAANRQKVDVRPSRAATALTGGMRPKSTTA